MFTNTVYPSETTKNIPYTSINSKNGILKPGRQTPPKSMWCQARIGAGLERP